MQVVVNLRNCYLHEKKIMHAVIDDYMFIYIASTKELAQLHWGLFQSCKFLSPGGQTLPVLGLGYLLPASRGHTAIYNHQSNLGAIGPTKPLTALGCQYYNPLPCKMVNSCQWGLYTYYLWAGLRAFRTRSPVGLSANFHEFATLVIPLMSWG